MKKIKTKIMEKIRKDEIKMKPGWWFEGISWSLKAGNWLTIMVASIFLAWGIFWMEMVKPLEALSYGDLGRELVLESIPYLSLIVGVVSLIAGVIFYKNRGENYKKSRERIWITVVLTVVITTILFSVLRSMLEPEILLRII